MSLLINQGRNMSGILILHGPNLNMLGVREPETYGSMTLASINQQLSTLAQQAGVACKALQSNSEAELIDAIHQAYHTGVQYIVINPAAFTHTSVALRDALLAVNIPFVEVHLSNVYQRESFRHHSFFSDIAQGVICGLGYKGYVYAMQNAIEFIQNQSN